LAACGLLPASRPEVFVPLQNSAREQFNYAKQYEEQNRLALVDRGNPTRVRDRTAAVIAAFAKVVEHFPDDRDFTPLARLEIADLRAGLEISRLEPSRRDLRAAISEFQNLRREYPEYEYIQAKAAYDEALCWRKLKDYERAQDLFRHVMDTYGSRDDPVLKQISEYARALYQQTYIR